MNVADTSVVVAAFAPWHPDHEAARRASDSCRALIAHVALESYSVLTRMPASGRADPLLVAEYLRTNFPEPRLRIPARLERELVSVLARAGISGGATYDAVVAISAREAGARLLTRDRRALPTYEALGADVEYVD